MLKNWYQNNIKVSDENIFSKLKPNWTEIYVKQQGSHNVYEVSLQDEEKLVVRTNEEKRELKEVAAHSEIRLLIFEEKSSNKILYASYMNMQATTKQALNNLHYKDVGNFSGTILYYHFTGNLSNGWNYISGKVTEKITTITETQFTQSQKQTQGDRNTEGTVCKSGFADKYQWQCVGVPGAQNCGFNYVGKEYVSYCYWVANEETIDHIALDEGVYIPPIYIDCAGVPNGTATSTNECNTCIGGTTGLTACPKDIRNKTLDSCISANVNSLLNSSKNIEGKMADIIKKFDPSKTLNINIHDGQTSNGKSGEMFHWSLNGSTFDADIRLQTSYFKGQDGASKESLAAVLIHEILHSYIVSQNPALLDTAGAHHNMIDQNYIAPMSDYLVTIFGISRKDAFSLAWNGVIDSKVFEKANSDRIFSYTYTENGLSHTVSISKQEIKNRAGAYNANFNYGDEGIKGTKTCPN